MHWVNGGHGGFKAATKIEAEGYQFWDPLMEATRVVKRGSGGSARCQPFGAALVGCRPTTRASRAL